MARPVQMKALIWTGEDLGAAYDVVDIPADYADQAAERYRATSTPPWKAWTTTSPSYSEEGDLDEESLKDVRRPLGRLGDPGLLQRRSRTRAFSRSLTL